MFTRNPFEDSFNEKESTQNNKPNLISQNNKLNLISQNNINQNKEFIPRRSISISSRNYPKRQSTTIYYPTMKKTNYPYPKEQRTSIYYPTTTTTRIYHPKVERLSIIRPPKKSINLVERRSTNYVKNELINFPRRSSIIYPSKTPINFLEERRKKIYPSKSTIFYPAKKSINFPVRRTKYCPRITKRSINYPYQQKSPSFYRFYSPLRTRRNTYNFNNYNSDDKIYNNYFNKDSKKREVKTPFGYTKFYPVNYEGKKNKKSVFERKSFSLPRKVGYKIKRPINKFYSNSKNQEKNHFENRKIKSNSFFDDMYVKKENIVTNKYYLDEPEDFYNYHTPMELRSILSKNNEFYY